MNSRLDEMQAAILRARLPLLAALDRQRRALAAAYRARLPVRRSECRWSGIPVTCIICFPCRTLERDALQAHLRSAGIETLVHYPVPIRTAGVRGGPAGRSGRWPAPRARGGAVAAAASRACR